MKQQHLRERYWIDHFSQQGIRLTNIRKLKKITEKKITEKRPRKWAAWTNCYTAKHAAEALGVSIEVFHRLIKEGKVRPMFLPLLKNLFILVSRLTY
jgi:hypothetical protein